MRQNQFENDGNKDPEKKIPKRNRDLYNLERN